MGNTNICTLPYEIALAQDAAQERVLSNKSQEIQENNKFTREHLQPTLHAIEGYLRDKQDSYDVSELALHAEALNTFYEGYRTEFANQDGIDAGLESQQFPETLFPVDPADLSKLSHSDLKSIEGKLKEMLDHTKSFNNQATQDLYLMIQMGVALITAFQKAQEDMTNHMRHLSRNQRP